MTRKIKFRAWDKKLKMMFPTEQIEFYGWGQINIIDEEGDSEARDVELMQYTGLKDKNGVEIYEGGIVKWGSVPYESGRVEYVNACFKVVGVNLEDRMLQEDDLVEVIGNIYENKDLLK